MKTNCILPMPGPAPAAPFLALTTVHAVQSRHDPAFGRSMGVQLAPVSIACQLRVAMTAHSCNGRCHVN